MDLLEFMEVEASDKSTSASSSAGAADTTGRPRKRRRAPPAPNTRTLAGAGTTSAITTTTITSTHDTHDTHDEKTTTTTASTTEELERVAHAAEAVVAVDADGGGAFLGPEGGPPRLVDYPDSEGADEADLDAGDSEATELPDESAEVAREDEGEGDGGGAKVSETREQEGDEDSEMTQSMDMEEMHAGVVVPAVGGHEEEGKEEEKDKEKRGKEERSAEEGKNERDERAGDEPGRRETAASGSAPMDGGAGGEQGRRAKVGDKAKRRLPDWMVLTPKQLQQAQAEKEREMRESKVVLREQALRFFEIMQCSSSSSSSALLESSSGSIGVDGESSAEQLAVALDAKPLIAVAPVALETKVLVSDTVRYTDVLLPIEEGRVVIFDLETSGFAADDSIIEIGAVELVDGQRTGVVFQSYAKAIGSINPYAFKAHGLSEDFLSHHQSIEIVLANFMRWVGHSPLVAHNSRFDMRMLCQELRRWDIPLHGNKVFCTLRYYRAKYPGMAYSLDDLASHFRIDQIIERRTHGALVDAEICARVYQKFLDAL